MSKECKFKIVSTFIISWAFGFLCVSGTLYEWCEYLADMFDYETKLVFTVVGVTCSIICLIIICLVLRTIGRELFPKLRK